VKNRDVYWTEEPYCSLLKKNLMTCCDLAAVTKPWTIHRDVVDLVTKEFFAQGDRERTELNKEPNVKNYLHKKRKYYIFKMNSFFKQILKEMMDARRSHELPRLQIGWIDNICMPLYTVRYDY
jgi:dual 3',5'-cyclic-AMP and -GMP phosphodiesterase 11